MESTTNGFFIVYAIISIAVTIFLIVKFLQIAKDVRKIRTTNVCNFSDWRVNFRILLAQGYKEEAKKLLFTEIWSDNIASEAVEYRSYDQYKNLKTEYKQFLDQIGEDLPDYEAIMGKRE